MIQENRTGLVLEGGAMRGIYTAGVLDVFLENQVRFAGVLGVSAGALHGCSFASGQKGRSLRYYKKYRGDWRFMSYRSLLCTGDIVGEKFCYHDIPERLDPYDYEAFHKSGIGFYVGCSNVETGKPEYLRVTDMLRQVDLLRASASMPYVSRIVHYQGLKLLDGGCTDSIPVKAFREMGYGRTAVVLTRHEGYEKKPEKTELARMFYGRYPLFVQALEQRHIVYNRTLREIRRLEKAGEIFVLRPSEELKIGRMEDDPEILQRTYDIGRKDALAKVGELKEWLGER